MRLVFDVEANGLLRGDKLNDPVDKVWMVAATDLNNGRDYLFCDDASDPSAKPLADFVLLFDQAKELIAHNAINYDLPVLKKIMNWVPKSHTTIRDTMLMSQLLDYERFGKRGHSLAVWGEYLGIPKPVHEDWLNFSEEMVTRCVTDVRINRDVYMILSRELTEKLGKLKNPDYLKRSLRVEHDLSMFQARATEQGWVFNKPKALELKQRLTDEIQAIEDELHPQMPMMLKVMDKEERVPEYKKNGEYYARSVEHFPDIKGPDALTTRTLDGPFFRVKYLEPSISSHAYLKNWLVKKHNWVPIIFNWERVDGKLVKKSAKLCDESLNAIGPIGMLVSRYTTAKSRLGILNGWIENTDPDGRIRGDMFVIATPTGRSRHKLIANIPGPKAAWGEEMRSLFGCEEGYKVVGSDSSSNQMRALCHYLKNPEFTAEVVDGDVHQRNADNLSKIHPCDRDTAKPFLYAFLFGGGIPKLSLLLTGKVDEKIGKKAKKGFVEGIPGLKDLIDSLAEIYQICEAKGLSASIPAMDGRRVYLDSGHKALNYLLQSAEGITCKAAVSYAVQKFKEENIDARPLIFYHDEMQWAVRADQAERAAEIMSDAFREAPKWYGVECMEGKSKIGDNWYDTH
jgi:DNA polymerase I-like protein with 3'-5' exonuclease and polymerase domains